MTPFTRFANWPLRVKMGAMFVVASLLPLAIATAISVNESKHQMLRGTNDLLAARADQLAQRLDSFHSAYQLPARRIAFLPDVIDCCLASGEDLEKLKSRLASGFKAWISIEPGIRSIAVLDTSGKVKFSTESQLVGADLSYRPYVQEAMRGKATISDIHFAEQQVGGTPSIAYLSPIQDHNGRLIGITNISVRASAFWEMMKKADELAGASSYAVLFDHQGIRIAHTFSDDAVFHPGSSLDAAVMNAIVAEKRFGERTRELLEDVRAFPQQFARATSDVPDEAPFEGFAAARQKWVFGVGRRLSSVPWTVFYMVPEEIVFTPIQRMAQQKILFAGGISIVALICGALFATEIVRPIRALIKASQAITSGDYRARVTATHTDELGQLGSAFNAMAIQLESQSSALELSRQELERRVQDRTAALETVTLDLKQEVEERKQTETTLAQSEAKLQTILENLDEGVVVADLNGKLMHLNRSAIELHGDQNLAKFKGTFVELERVFELSRMDGAPLSVDQWPLARILRGETLHDYEVRFRHAQSATQRIFSYGGTLVHDEEGKAIMAVVTIRDVTERMRAAEAIHKMNADLEKRVIERTSELQLANKELEAFSYSVSHDLRAPLRSLDGFSQALMDDCAEQLSPDGHDNLRRIRAASQRMGHLIDDLLNLSRLGRAEISRQTVDMSVIAQEIVRELHQSDPKRDVVVVIKQGLVADADPRLIRVLLTNLISNAWKFSAKNENARIEVGCTQERAQQVFHVRDNGVGFDMAYAGKLFGAFQRLHSVNEFPGTGIGLATAHRIVHRHGGRIWAESSPGAGATFKFTL